MNSKYRILKLRSGEEIIAQIVGQSNGKMIIERPMVFKSLLVEKFGMKREITVLKNWLFNSSQVRTEIPKDHIATFLEPHSVVEELYEFEKDKEDIDPKEKSIFTPPPSEIESNDPFDVDPEIIEDHMQKLLDAMKNNAGPELHHSNADEMEDDINDRTEYEQFIILNMMFPPSILRDMINNGLLDPDELRKINDDIDAPIDSPIEEITNVYTGDEEDRDDYGNKWTDWSNDINEYLE
jgi:hypothetical protein